jgi:hypothetical protein
MITIAATGQLLVHQALDLSSPATRKLASFLNQPIVRLPILKPV